jgi:Suppressor of fused protein (SUFU)
LGWRRRSSAGAGDCDGGGEYELMISLNPFRKSKDVSIIKSVGDHVESHFGKIAWVMHEKESPDIHVDVYVVEATPERNYKRLVTSGMSEKAMVVPAGASDCCYAELTLCLQPDWPLSPDAFKDESNYWPVRLLKGLARFPHKNKTWVYAGHSMDWSNPPRAFAANTAMTSVAILWPKLSAPEAQTIFLSPKKTARLWAVYPLHEVEGDFKIKNGSEALESLLDAAGVTELLHPGRKSVVKPN